MSIAKRGSRRVREGEIEYLWTLRKEPTRAQAAGETPMRLAVQAARPGPHCVLTVDLRIKRPDNDVFPTQTGITPAVVRDIVRGALAQGWEPLTAGPPFAFTYPLHEEHIGLTFGPRW